MSLSIEAFKKALPEKCRKSVNQELVDQINAVLDDPNMYETYREHLLSYTKVLEDGRFKLTDYIRAVKYCSLRLVGNTQFDAYIKTFPERYEKFVQQGIPTKDIHSYVSGYNKSKLVSMIMEQSMIPTWVLNQDLYQKAINVQAELMVSAQSEKVRSDAANSLLTHLRPPENFKVELDIGQKQTDAITELNNTLMKLAEQQRQMITVGAASAKQIAESRIVAVVNDDDDV